MWLALYLEIKKFCLEFLETYLCSDNCLKIMEFALSRNVECLREKAENYFLKNFRYVIFSQEFKQLTLPEFNDVLQKARKSSFKVSWIFIYVRVLIVYFCECTSIEMTEINYSFGYNRVCTILLQGSRSCFQFNPLINNTYRPVGRAITCSSLER